MVTGRCGGYEYKEASNLRLSKFTGSILWRRELCLI